MKILAVGGGSGGHVIPVGAVFKQILKNQKDVKLVFWCDKKFRLQAEKIMFNEFGGKVKVQTISSGKLRRYNHLTFWQHLTIPSIIFNNFIDIFKNIVGVFQAFFRLIFWRPDVVFCKGGFVCVPAGVAAWILRIPVVIHDSDAHAGLANRILSKFARKITTGAPLEFYNYPPKISKYVGIPVMDNFREYSLDDRKRFKKELGFFGEMPLVVVTGGGLGANRLNNAVVDQIYELSKKAEIVLISGMSQFNELKSKLDNPPKNFHIFDFISDEMWKYLAAADLVVARAGATSNLELASLAKPTILVPNARLTGGHQIKNAEVYAKNGAVEVVSDDEIEDSPQILTKKVFELLNDKPRMKQMSSKFVKFSKPEASKEVAQILLSFKK